MRLIFPACLILTLLPLTAWSDQCDSLYDQASQVFESARSASERQDYESAERWYGEAASYYEQVSQMTGCRCPKIAGSARTSCSTARNNADICRRNIETVKENARRKAEYEAKAKEIQELKVQKAIKEHKPVPAEDESVPQPFRSNSDTASNYWNILSQASRMSQDSGDAQGPQQ